MARVKDLKGHTGRVLSLCVSPDGSTALSAGADETLRFWECFGAAAPKKKKHAAALGSAAARIGLSFAAAPPRLARGRSAARTRPVDTAASPAGPSPSSASAEAVPRL